MRFNSNIELGNFNFRFMISLRGFIPLSSYLESRIKLDLIVS